MCYQHTVGLSQLFVQASHLSSSFTSLIPQPGTIEGSSQPLSPDLLSWMHLQSLYFFSFPLLFLGLGHHVLIMNFCSNLLNGLPASRLTLIHSHCHSTVHSKKSGLQWERSDLWLGSWSNLQTRNFCLERSTFVIQGGTRTYANEMIQCWGWPCRRPTGHEWSWLGLWATWYQPRHQAGESTWRWV